MKKLSLRATIYIDFLVARDDCKRADLRELLQECVEAVHHVNKDLVVFGVDDFTKVLLNPDETIPFNRDKVHREEYPIQMDMVHINNDQPPLRT